MVFLGPPGVGKTHLAIALGVLTAELGHRIYFNIRGESYRLKEKRHAKAAKSPAELAAQPA